jgi:hypothetical protein
MAFVIRRLNEVFNSSDRLYLLITPPPEPHTFKVVAGWRDYDKRGGGGTIFEHLRWQP